jgi:hypothetical protein
MQDKAMSALFLKSTSTSDEGIYAVGHEETFRRQLTPLLFPANVIETTG